MTAILGCARMHEISFIGNAYATFQNFILIMVLKEICLQVKS